MDADFMVTSGWEGEVILHLQPDTARGLAKALRLYNTLRIGKGLAVDSGWEEVAKDLDLGVDLNRKARR